MSLDNHPAVIQQGRHVARRASQSKQRAESEVLICIGVKLPASASAGIMRVLALGLLTTAAGLTTYAPPPLRVLESPTRDEVDACAATMCEGFWTTSQLTPAQVAALHKTQSDDFRTRFSGKRRLRGSLLVVPDGDEGVAAMASLELGLVDVVARAVLPRDDAERKFIAALGRLTTRDPVWKSTS
jgi:hypothetical protein